MKYYIFFILCLSLLLSCTTIKFGSVFKKKPIPKDFVVKEINNTVHYQEEIVLKNNLHIILKQSTNENVKISFYLKNSPLYQSQINSGIEKIILSYIKKNFQDKVKDKINQKIISEIEIFSNKDITSLSVYTKKENIKQIYNFLTESMKINSFNSFEISNIKEELLNNYKKLNNEKDYYLNQKLEKHIFRNLNIQIPFDGNSVSLRAISNDEIQKYYKNYFNTKRMLILITGNITNKDFNFQDFKNLESGFVSQAEDLNYSKIESSYFETEPVFYDTLTDSKELIYITSLYSSPALTNDDYFAFCIANKILKENFYRTSNINKNFDFSGTMINSVNFGKLYFKTNRANLEENILSLRRCLEKVKQGIGEFYYYKDSITDVVEDYKQQKEDKIVTKNIYEVLDKYKKEVNEDFDIMNLNNIEKERKFASMFFLFNQIVESSTIEEKIYSVTEKDVLRIFDVYFNKFAWGVLADKKTLDSLSKDFF
jgi:predicted Zn-dependent peptidase